VKHMLPCWCSNPIAGATGIRGLDDGFGVKTWPAGHVYGQPTLSW
jgi:hypothetical protein